MPDRFVVPQFIDVEAKVFGPVTARQFLIMLVAGLFIFIEYQLFDFSLFLLTAVITFMLGLIIGFVKINGQNFHYFLLNIGITFKRPSLRIWQKTKISTKKFVEKKKKQEKMIMSSKSRIMAEKGKSLSEIALIVNTGGYYKGE